MKFTKLAIAVAAVVGSVAASAQTANVTLYGSIRLNVESARYSNGVTKSTNLVTLENVSSRFGFRGSESLGGGLNAIFQVEAGFASDTGNGGSANGSPQLFGRESWVGLNGGFGEIKFGYGLTPFDDVLGWAHHQGANSWENRNNGVGGGAGFAKRDLFTNYVAGANCTSSAFDARYANSISYATPNVSGFQVRTQYAFLGEAASNSCSGFDTAVRYASGPVRVGLAYAMHNNFTALGALALPHDADALRGYVSFDAGFARFDASYETARYKPDAGGSLKYKYWDIGALAPFGANTLGVQYGQRDNGLAACYSAATQALTVTAACLANWSNGGGKHLSVTYDYALSKRTLVRSYFSDLKNETGQKVRATSVGLWHSF